MTGWWPVEIMGLILGADAIDTTRLLPLVTVTEFTHISFPTCVENKIIWPNLFHEKSTETE
jgi:hypothetical protein